MLTLYRGVHLRQLTRVRLKTSVPSPRNASLSIQSPTSPCLAFLIASHSIRSSMPILRSAQGADRRFSVIE